MGRRGEEEEEEEEEETRGVRQSDDLYLDQMDIFKAMDQQVNCPRPG